MNVVKQVLVHVQVMSAERKERFESLVSEISNMVYTTQQFFEKLLQQLEVGLQDIDRQYAAAQY